MRLAICGAESEENGNIKKQNINKCDAFAQDAAIGIVREWDKPSTGMETD